MNYNEIYRSNVEPVCAEGMSYRTADLAIIGACASDSTLNINVLPSFSSLFEVIHELAIECASLASADEKSLKNARKEIAELEALRDQLEEREEGDRVGDSEVRSVI